jgi:hypothetical protein
MNFAVEKNEIAGPDAQKVPGSSPKEAFAVQAAGDSAGASDSGHSGHNQDAADSNFVMDWPAKAGELNLDAGTGAVAASSANHAAMQAERIGHMVSQQVVLIRQSGAGNLGVTLRLDPQTELNLQLTNHNGRIEASVRVERGAVAGLDGHWKDLQDSLARQNVQLFPLEGKAAARTSVFGSASDSANTTSFRQPSQNPQGQSREAPQGWPLAGAVQSVPPTEKATTRTVSRQGWESWA